MPQSKLSAFLSVLLVFVGGVAVGALGYRLYDVKTIVSPAGSVPKKMSPEEVRKRVVARMKDAVKLDDQQVTQLQQIMDQTHEEFEQINARTHAQMDPVIEPLKKKADQDMQSLREQQVAKVRAMLRADQLPLYEKYLADRDAERKKKQQEHKDGKGPGPGSPPSRP